MNFFSLYLPGRSMQNSNVKLPLFVWEREHRQKIDHVFIWKSITGTRKYEWFNTIAIEMSSWTQDYLSFLLLISSTNTYPFKIEEIFFKRLPGLYTCGLVYNVWIGFIPTAFIILWAMTPPVSTTHPAKIYNSNQDETFWQQNTTRYGSTVKSWKWNTSRIFQFTKHAVVVFLSRLCSIVQSICRNSALCNNKSFPKPVRHRDEMQ